MTLKQLLYYTTGKIDKVKKCNFVNINDLNQWEQQTSLKESSFDNLNQKIIVPINHSKIVEDLIEQNVDLFAKKDTDIEKTNTIKMSIVTGNHPPNKLILKWDHTEILWLSIQM